MAEKRIDYEFVLEDVWSENTTITDSNPLGKVPTLVMEDEGAIFDSRVIVEYLDTLTPVGRLIPASGRERAEVKCWEALADGLVDAALLVRLEHNLRPESQRSANWIERQGGKVERSLEALANGLGEKSFCTGVHYCLADIALGCALGWLEFRFPENSWRSRHPNLARFADRLNERPSFRETAPS